MQQDNLLNSLRDTQKLLDGRMDEIDTLSNVVSLLTPSIDKSVFFNELAEILFSRLQLEYLKFYSYSGELKPAWQMGCFENSISFNEFKAEPDSITAGKMREIVFGTAPEDKVFIPLLFGDTLYGVLSMQYPKETAISMFSRPFYYLLGSFIAAAVKIIDEWRALEDKTEKLAQENRLLKEIITGLGEQENTFVFQSESMNRLIEKVEKIKNIDVDILITGESGTGKDLLTRYIHYSSERKSKPFIAVNCAAIPESLVEGELFGIEEGVATGVNKRKGKFELADTGTIFLDEIGELPLAIQAKLLRLLQDKKVTPVGSDHEISLDIRVIAATNRNVEQLVKDGRFRQDLFYRLNNFPVYVPALRERKEDIVPLLHYFLKYFGKKYSKNGLTVDTGAEKAAKDFLWPGNVRELKNRILQAVIMADEGAVLNAASLGIAYSGVISQEQAGAEHRGDVPLPEGDEIPLWLDNELKRIEKLAFIQALRSSNGVKKAASELLGISLRSFHYKFKIFGITETEYR